MPIEISGTTVIDDSRNITNVGSIGDSNTVYYGDGSGLSGIEAGSSSFTATGAISNGDVVHINTDGTVSAPTVTNGAAISAATPKQFLGARIFDISPAYDTNSNKVVIAYKNSSDSKGYAIVGTVDNVANTMTFGSPTKFETGNVSDPKAVFDSSNNKVVIAYSDASNSSYGTAVVGTVSGDSISFGTPVVFNSGSSEQISAVFDSNSNKVAVFYRNGGNSQYGDSHVGTVSGTSISFGSRVTFNSGTTNYISAVFNPDNNKVVVAYRDDGASSYGKIINGTVSGSSISFGSERNLANKRTDYISTTYDTSADRIIIAYNDDSSNQRGKVKVAQASGDNFSFGSETEFNGSPTNNIAIVYDSASNRVMIAFKGEYSGAGTGNQQGYVLPATVSGTSISIGSSVQFDPNTTNQIGAVYDPDANRTIVAYLDDTIDVGETVVVSNSTTTLTTENYIGIAAEAISNGSSGSITMVTGINASQSSLTAGQQYFVSADGSISESTTSVFAGTAISATKLIVKR